MIPVTDPKILAQLEQGSSGSMMNNTAPINNAGSLKPVTDPNTIAQLEAPGSTHVNMQSSSNGNSNLLDSFLDYQRRGALDTVAGLAQMGHGLLNTPHNLVNLISPTLASHIPSQQNYDFGSMLGLDNPNLADKLMQGAAQYAPYLAGGEAALGEKALGELPLLSKVPLLRNVSQAQPVAGAVFGATQSNNPLQGAITNALLNTGLSAAGEAIGTIPNIKNAVGNFILNRLNKSATQGSALSPTETAENLATNFTDMNGQPLPVDIGTVTNNPALKNTYNALKYVPFSGASKQSNLLKNQLLDKNIGDIQNQIGQITNDQSNLPLEAQLNNTLAKQDQLNNTINQSPDFLNALANGIKNRANMTSELKNSALDLYKSNKVESKNLYDPINNSDLRLDKLGIDNLFPNYANAANDLLAKQENFENLFDTDADLGTKLKAELAKAKGILTGGNDYGVTLPEAVTRIQNLGNLAASATSLGKRYEGKLLGDLGNSLKTDLDNALRSSGNDELANQLQVANEYHKNNIVPFYQNNEIRKAVTDKNYIPTGAKLAKALHDPNNQTILNQLPQNTQNATLYQLMTGGKGSSSGVANLTAEDIAKAYQRLPVDTKTMVAQYNPQADQLFENLPGAISQRDQLLDTQNQLNKQLEMQSANKQKNLDKLQTQLQQVKSQKFGGAKENSPGSNLLEKGVKGLEIGGAALAAHYLSPWALLGTVPAGIVSRSLSKTLTNPELVQAYIKGSQLPVLRNAALSNALARALSSTITPQVTRGNQ